VLKRYKLSIRDSRLQGSHKTIFIWHSTYVVQRLLCEINVPQLIFVYGSLKRGYALNNLLGGQCYLSDAITAPLYRLVDLGTYPGLVDWPDGLAVRGEVFRVDFDCLLRLDEAEGVTERHYVRRNVILQENFSDRDVHAWFWLGPVKGKRDCGEEWP
jgi:gamma-glutamylaminecyclotransferase